MTEGGVSKHTPGSWTPDTCALKSLIISPRDPRYYDSTPKRSVEARWHMNQPEAADTNHIEFLWGQHLYMHQGKPGDFPL